jgi:hypothetical protein
MTGHALLVTRRALIDDLGLSPKFAGCDAKSLFEALIVERVAGSASDPANPTPLECNKAMAWVGSSYPILGKFQSHRSGSPEGQEATKNLMNSAGRVFNLHADRWRGVTWWDQANNVVWLCASGYHSSGSPDDFYPFVVGLDASQELLPTVDEIDEAKELSHVEAFIDVLEELLAKARAVPGTEFRTEFTNQMRSAGTTGSHVAVYAELAIDPSGSLEEVFVGVRTIGTTGVGDLLQVCLTAMFPDAEESDVLFRSGFPHRDAAPGERVASVTGVL